MSAPVSVLMSVYAADRPQFLEQALESLCQQTLAPQDVVLVNDGPLTPALEQVISHFKPRLPLRCVGFPQNQGLAAALNLGLSYCQCPYVARMDADDICLSHRLESQLEFMQANPQVDIAGSYVMEIDANGHKGRERQVPTTHDSLVSKLWACPFLHPTIIFRKEAVLKLGGYKTSLRRRQDYELWFRCAQAGLAFANIPDVLLYYRFEPDTHKKQPTRLALQQGMIGFRGSRAMGLALWKQLACYVPFLRSLLPGPLEHAAYRFMKRFDPRT